MQRIEEIAKRLPKILKVYKEKLIPDISLQL